MAKLIIAGYGFVGAAVGEALDSFHEILICDPKLNNRKVYDHPDVDGVILCLPTPQNEDGSCDISYLEAVLEECYPDIPILIKSTMSIEGYRYLKDQFSTLKINYSPEFLTAANANKDFKDQKYYYIAGPDNKFWDDVFKTALPDAVQKPASSIEELILVKYFRNSFLATKVAYANQMYDFCKFFNVSYEKVREKFGEDPRIGYSHTQVPGPDNERGFGGACFPKDTSAILYTADFYDLELRILKAVVDYNNKLKEE
jgi:nucleotide sugar dehydrogenase